MKWISWISVHQDLDEWIYSWQQKKNLKLLILSRILCWGQESVVDTDNLERVPCSGAEPGSIVWMVGREVNEVCQAALLGVAELNPSINNGFHSGKPCAHPGQPHTETFYVSVATGVVPSVSCHLQPPAHAVWWSTQRDLWKCGNTQSHLLGTSMGHGREGWGLVMASLPSRHFLQSHCPGKCAMLWELL